MISASWCANALAAAAPPAARRPPPAARRPPPPFTPRPPPSLPPSLQGGALLHIQSDLGASDAALSAIVGAAKLGAVAGTVLGAALMLYYGRRPAIAVDSAFFVAGPLVMAGAWGVSGLVAGRVIVGLGIGVSAVVVPAYLAEVAPARLRGRTVELYELMLCLGMLAAALADAALDGAPAGWRWMVGLPAVPGALMAGERRRAPAGRALLPRHARTLMPLSAAASAAAALARFPPTCCCC
jgi:MFS family permease